GVGDAYTVVAYLIQLHRMSIPCLPQTPPDICPPMAFTLPWSALPPHPFLILLVDLLLPPTGLYWCTYGDARQALSPSSTSLWPTPHTRSRSNTLQGGALQTLLYRACSGGIGPCGYSNHEY